jgi:hypothetical protein
MNVLVALFAAIGVASCTVDIQDRPGRSCDPTHACTHGRVCVNAICLDPSADASSPADASTAADGSTPADASLRDASTSPISCSTATVAFCEDFERGRLPSRPGERTATVAADLVIDSTFAHSGSRSLHARGHAATAGGEVEAFLIDGASSPPISAGIFVRAYIYVPAYPALPASVFLASAPDSAFTVIIRADGSFGSGIQWYANPSANMLKASSVKLMPSTWTCVEWQIESAGMSSRTHVWIDGQPLVDLDLFPTRIPAFTELDVGPLISPTIDEGPYEMWIDSVAADTQRIGCRD